MKKLLLTTAIMLCAVMAQAQTKVSAKLTDGFKAVYAEESTITMAGQSEVKSTTVTEYVVSDVTPQGAVITATVTEVTSDAAPGDLTATLLTISERLMKGFPLKVNVDADGQVKSIANIDALKARVDEAATALTAEIFKNVPGIGDAMSSDKLKEQLLSKMSEEELFNSLAKSGVLSLNGKTIKNGATEDITESGMKMKRMYFVSGKNIVANATLNMTKDELKAFIIAQVEKEAPEQAELIKQNIDAVMGQMKFDINVKNTYTLGDNGWVTGIKSEMKQDVMGQVISGSSVVTLK